MKSGSLTGSALMIRGLDRFHLSSFIFHLVEGVLREVVKFLVLSARPLDFNLLHHFILHHFIAPPSEMQAAIIG